MAKTKEELNTLKQECEALNNKLNELTSEELEEVAGGNWADILKKIGEGLHSTTKPVVSVPPAPAVGKSVNVNEVLTSTHPNLNNQEK